MTDWAKDSLSGLGRRMAMGSEKVTATRRVKDLDLAAVVPAVPVIPLAVYCIGPKVCRFLSVPGRLCPRTF